MSAPQPAGQPHEASSSQLASTESSIHTGSLPPAPPAPATTTAATTAAIERVVPLRAGPPSTGAPATADSSAAKIVFSPRDEQITTLIAASLRLKGTLQGPEGVMVKGTLDGDILIDGSGEHGTGTVVVFEGAVVNGMISGRRVIVFGTVNGPIISRTILTLAETGVVNGDVYYNRMINSDGGTIEGQLRRIRDGHDPLPEVLAQLGRSVDA